MPELHINRNDAQKSKYEQAFDKFNLHLDDAQVSAQVHKLVTDNRSKYNTPEVLKQLLSTIELTTLKVTDSQESVLQLTERVNDFSDAHPDLPPLATICVYPNFANIVREPRSRRRQGSLRGRRVPLVTNIHRNQDRRDCPCRI